MKILITIGHPAHVHFFKNFVWKMEKKGHIIKIFAEKKDVSTDLLDTYNFRYCSSSVQKSSILGIINEQLSYEYRLYKIAKKFKPDIITGIGGTAASHISQITKIKSIIFTDSEPVLANMITFPFADVICTPLSFTKNLGKKQVRYNSYHELAYLHLNYFSSNKKIYSHLNLGDEEKFVLMRFVAWKASHDKGKHGILLEDKKKLVLEMEKYARVFITSESPLPPELEKYKVTFSPEKIHDALYFADMLIGDSQTMTTEAGVLGTPAIRCNSFVGENDMGNFIELEQKYGLIFNYRDPEKAINKAIELIQKPDLKEEWQKKREKFLKDKIDVTAFMVWFIENYPESFREMKENPKIQAQSGKSVIF